MYLLDTNCISELRKGHRADRNVAAWAKKVPSDTLYLSVITIEELEIGILRVERRDAAQAAPYRTWMHRDVLPHFAHRILSIDQTVALRAARLHVPDPRPIRDTLIAATALVHGMTVVTRNIPDFASTGVSMLNPWLG